MLTKRDGRTSLFRRQQPHILDAPEMLGPVKSIPRVPAVVNRRISAGIEQNTSNLPAAVERREMKWSHLRVPMHPQGIGICTMSEQPLQ